MSRACLWRLPDYLKTLPTMISKWLPRQMAILGTDGFGHEGRTSLREFFEVDSRFVVLAALHELAKRDWWARRRCRMRSRFGHPSG